MVSQIDASGVAFGDRRIDAHTVLWAAGVQASPLAARLGETDRAGRQLELLVEGGKIESASPAIEGEEAVWTVTPAGSEPLVMLLRDSQKPDVYLQKFILKP